MSKSYSELMRIESFEDRLEYLELNGVVGSDTFGFDRYLNQIFYKSIAWRQARDFVLVRDHGCDLAHLDYPIMTGPIVHHINPITVDQLVTKDDIVVDPDNLITTTHNTHNIIHYGIDRLAPPSGPRTPGDTKLW